ncbi:unnamed protein product [Brassica napus]|uniref:(rape) hypothetical protein n=1 Tax=Brassica napus TaxID=3708 RepID=A0A816N105_BRANA|nr:unnamed protein product [Brassica napus]
MVTSRQSSRHSNQCSSQELVRLLLHLIQAFQVNRSRRQQLCFHKRSSVAESGRECGFESKNATWWTVPAKSTAEIAGDCKTWSNKQSHLCYACESCKIGVFKGIRKRWRILLVFNLLVTLLVVLLYSCGCCVRRNNRVQWKRRFFE